MAELEPAVIAVVALASVLVALLLVFIIASFVMIRKKRLLCFRRDEYARPFLLADREMERGRGRRRKKRKIERPTDRRPANKRPNAKRKSKNYQSIGRGPKFPKSDPFASSHLENPMVNMEDFNTDWTNPAFDEERAQIFDAAVVIQAWYRMVRKRMHFLELKRATILAQSLFRGRKARAMVPRLRKEKAQRDQLRKKQVGWKKKGTLAALKYYNVKAFGFAEVEQLYGMETVRDAADQLKNLYGGKGKMKLKMFISVKGIKLYHVLTMEHFATVKVSTVSFCTLDPKNRKLFAFINRKKRRNFCHVFQATESDAQKMVETMAEAFEVTFRRQEMQQKRSKELERLQQVKRASFTRQSQQLDDELASMLEMAETASSGIVQDRQSEISSEEAEGSIRGSRELLLATPKRRSAAGAPSGLVTSARAPSLAVQEAKAEPEEPFDAKRVDEYFTGIKEGVDFISLSLEREGRRTRVLGEKKQLDKSLGNMVERFT